jgi:peptidoglycan-associated lipoprotein
MNNAIRVLVLALAAVTVVGCKKPAVVEKDNATTTIPDNTGEKPMQDDSDEAIWARKDPREILDKVACMKQRVITFDLDRSEVKGEYQEMLGCHARFLKLFSAAKLSLEGHTDERATREYNLGLGERRGNSVSDMLKAQGAGAEQISVISYGEERPTCTESDESCWGQNRRAEFVYSGI